jgi:hypothetical protein
MAGLVWLGQSSERPLVTQGGLGGNRYLVGRMEVETKTCGEIVYIKIFQGIKMGEEKR